MPIIKDVKWGEDNSIEQAPELTEEEQHALKQKMEAMDKLLATQQKAKYKIELHFSYRRSSRAPFPGALSIWESGTKLHGGGDTKVYECPGQAEKKNDCTAFIPDVSTGYGYLVCPGCKTVWQGEQVHGERFAVLTTQNWARLVLNYFIRLGHNADIYVKLAQVDMRVAAHLEQQRQMGGEKLHGARTQRVPYIYPLRNIIKDTAAGSDLLERFTAFLSA